MPNHNGKLMVPRAILDGIIAEALTLNEARIVLGLMLSQDLQGTWFDETGAWNPAVQFDTSSHIRSLILPEGANDNRALREGIERLNDTLWFDTLAISENARIVYWKFHENVVGHMAHKGLGEPYALIDTDLFRDLKSAVHQRVYLQYQSVAKTHRPMFDLLVDPHRWTEDRKSALRAMQRLSDQFNVTFHVASCYEMPEFHLEYLRVKVASDETRWHATALKKFPPNAGVTIVRP